MKITKSVISVIYVFLANTSWILARIPASFRIGSVFLERDLNIHNTFGQIFDNLNKNENYLNGTRVDFNIQYAELDQFDAYQKACMEMTYRVVAVFGSSPSLVDSSVASVCSALKVPYLTTHPVLASSENIQARKFAVHLGPSQNDLIQAVKDTIERLKWSEMALLSHRETGSLDAHQLVELLQSQGVKVRLLDLKRGDIRPGLAELRNRGIQNFLVDIGAEFGVLKLFFDEAMKAGIVHEKSTFLCASLDLMTVDMEDLRHTGSSIIGFTILDVKNYELAKTSGEMSQELSLSVSRSHKAALIYDGVHLFSRAVENLIQETDLKTPQVGCDNKEVPYDMGNRLLQEINKAQHNGLTGQITIKNGLRQTVDLKIMRLNPTGQFSKVGIWSRAGNEIRSELEPNPTKRSILKNSSTLIVKTRLTSLNSYMTKKITPNDMALQTGEYQGFLKDLLDQLAEDLEFDYVINEDLIHGFPSTDGNWTGLIGSLVDREADLGLDDLTITSQRSQVVDFSAPYETSTLEIMLQKSVVDLRGMAIHSFFDPFSTQVWLSILIAYILVSLLMFVIARVTPYERHASPRDGNDNSEENAGGYSPKLTLSNAFWYTLSGCVFKSTNINPRSLSTRLLAAFWSFFCLVMVMIYMLSLKRLIFPTVPTNHMTLQDLLRDEHFKFLVYPQGSTQFLLQNSPDEVHQQLWRKVDYEKSKQILNLIDGAAIVQSNPHYGFIMESVQAEGLMKKYCNLKTLGDLGQRHYALAFPKGSEWTDKVSKQILRYVETGTIYHLKRKWNLPQNCVQSTANETSSSTLVRSLPYHGPFMLLLISGIAALALAFMELFFYSILRSKRATFCLPPYGPTSSRGGKTCSIIKDELISVISFKTHNNKENVRKRSKMEIMLGGGGTPSMNGGTHLSPRITNNHRRANGGSDILKTTNNHNGYKNGQFYQAQALLRKDASLEQEDNAQL